MKIYHSFSSEETKLLGDRIAKQVFRLRLKLRTDAVGFRFPAFAKASAGKQVSRKKGNPPSLKLRRGEGAFILALRGDLGTGKTTFSQGFLRGLGVRGRVSSPTFLLMKRFKLKNGRFKNVYHIDCYRVKKSAELSSLGLKEVFENPENIVLVEWPERLGGNLPKKRVNLVFKHGKDEKVRTIKVV